MIDILFKLFSELSVFIGYIKNGVYPSPLSSDDEKKYVKEYLENKSQEARRILIEHNLRLVVHIAKKYETSGDGIEELISIGSIGLIKGVDSFDHSKGVKIATYCAKCIENEILMYYRGIKKLNQEISLSDSIGQDKEGNDITLMDIIPNGEKNIEEDYNQRHLLEKLQKYLKILSERELEIISYRYGLNNFPELTQKEIAKKFTISRSYVSRIEKRALIKLLYEYKKNNDI